MMTPRILLMSKSSKNNETENSQKTSLESKRVVWKMFPALNIPSFLDQTVEKSTLYPENGTKMESLQANCKHNDGLADNIEDNLQNGTDGNLYEVKYLERNSTWDVIEYLRNKFSISSLTLHAGNQILEDYEVKYNTRASLVIKNVNSDSFLNDAHSVLGTKIIISPSSSENEYSLSNLPAWTLKNDVLRHFRKFGKVKSVVLHYGITPDRLQFRMKQSNSSLELNKECTVNAKIISITRVANESSNFFSNGVESSKTDSDTGKTNSKCTMVKESTEKEILAEKSVSGIESSKGKKRLAEDEGLERPKKKSKLCNVQNTVSVRSMPRKEWKTMLREAFSKYGDIEKIFTRSIKGGLVDGFVTFSTEDAKSDAMKSSTVTLSNGGTYKVTAMEESDISKEVPKKTSSLEEEEPNTVIVKGILVFNCREKVRKAFSQIEKLEISPPVKGLTDAYVTFSSEEAMLSALNEKAVVLSDGETVTVMRKGETVKKSVVQPNVIFVHGLPAFCTCSHLRNTFASFGNIKHMFVSEGMAKIEFKFEDCVNRILKTRHINLFGSAADVRQETDDDIPPSFRIAYEQSITKKRKVLDM